MFVIAGRVFRLMMWIILVTRPAIAQVEYVPDEILERTRKLAKEYFAEGGFIEKFSERAFCFPSAESSYGLGEVINCVIVFGPKNFRVWLMDQKVQITQQNSSDDRNLNESRFIHNLIATVLVSVGEGRAKAYYLELDSDKFDSEGVLEAIEYKVPCLMCHPSGPRLIRPQLKAMSEMMEIRKNQLRMLNEEIAAYKIVDSYFPVGAAKSKLLPAQYEKHSQNVLTMKSCAECHNEKHGVRTKLTYAHKGTIIYQALNSASEFDKAFMPAYGHAGLSLEESSCLKSWLQLGVKMKSILGCQNILHVDDAKSNGLKRLVSKKSSNVFPTQIAAITLSKNIQSDLKAFVSTSLHDFEIDGFRLTGTLSKPIADKNSNYFELNAKISMLNLTSGISVRDRHIMKVLNVEAVPVAEVIGRIELKVRQNKNRFRLYCNQKKSDVEIESDCNSALNLCVISGLIDLQQCSVEAPKFLGISVDSKVEVKGIVRAN